MILCNDNFLNYAMTNYDNRFCKTVDDFNYDLNEIVQIKKLVNRIAAGEEVNVRLILNHMIIFFNVFKYDAAVNMLFFKIDQDKWVILYTFLDYLNFMPDYVESVGLSINDIEPNRRIKTELEKI